MNTDSDIEKLIEPGRPVTEVRPDGTKSMPARKYQTNIWMIIMLAVMVVFGFIVLYSVSGPDAYGQFQDSAYFLKRQLWFTLAGVAGCLIVAFIPINFFKQKFIMIGAYALSFGLALITLAMGQGGQQHGASRWITIGGIQFQSSELIKVALIIAFAGYRAMVDDLHRKGKIKAKNPGKQMLLDAAADFIFPIVAVIAVDFIILIEPHLSCFIIIAGVIFMCALSSEIPLKSWITGGLITLTFGVIALIIAMTAVPSFQEKITSNFAHVFKRLAIFTADEESENEEQQLTADDTRQIDNAFNALGSGGMWGTGLGNSRSKYNYVSEAQNDYIFSIYIEETGFVGGLILIGLYMIMFVMCVRVIWKARGLFARTVATGCTALIFIEVLLNLAVELQVIPSTGVTLPFISYGGTAQIFLMTAYGFILSVSRYATGPAPETKKKGAGA